MECGSLKPGWQTRALPTPMITFAVQHLQVIRHLYTLLTRAPTDAEMSACQETQGHCPVSNFRASWLKRASPHSDTRSLSLLHLQASTGLLHKLHHPLLSLRKTIFVWPTRETAQTLCIMLLSRHSSHSALGSVL